MRKSVIYDNCELYSPDDVFLGYIPKHRMEWYILKDLATPISENKIKLKFEPTFKKTNEMVDKEKHFPKKNICVICGEEDVLRLRKLWITPRQFKKHFPNEIKSRKTDDVVAVCSDHTCDLDEFVSDVKEDLYKKYNINVNDFKEDSKISHLKTIIKKILKNGLDTHPNNQYTKEKLIEHFGKIPSEEEMSQFVKVNPIFVEGCQTPEELVVKKVIENGETKEFFKLWKKEFYDGFEPEYLPWDFYNDLEENVYIRQS